MDERFRAIYTARLQLEAAAKARAPTYEGTFEPNYLPASVGDEIK